VKAIQMTEQGTPDVLRLVDLPDPVPGPGQVLVRVEAAAVNFSDVMRRRGDVYPVPTPSPFVPGAEVAGTVAAVGEDVDNFEIGTPVFGTVGTDASGGYAELALAYAGSLIRCRSTAGPRTATPSRPWETQGPGGLALTEAAQQFLAPGFELVEHRFLLLGRLDQRASLLGVGRLVRARR